MTDVTTYCDVNTCEDCPRYGDDCDGDKYIDRYPTIHEYAEGKRINPKLTDLISRADAIKAICNAQCELDVPHYPQCDQVKWCDEVKALLALPSADVVSRDVYDKRTQADEKIIDSYRQEFQKAISAETAMADNSLVNDITESPNDVVESKNDVIKKPRTVRYKLHKPIEYVSIEFDEEEEITHIDHYTAYGERRE